MIDLLIRRRGGGGHEETVNLIHFATQCLTASSLMDPPVHENILNLVLRVSNFYISKHSSLTLSISLCIKVHAHPDPSHTQILKS